MKRNPDKVREYNKRYYKKHKKEMNEYRKKHYQETREAELNQKSIYNKLNREKKQKCDREFYERNKNKEEYLKKTRVRGRDGYHKKEILEKFGNKCSKCGSREELQLHHPNYDSKPIVLCKKHHFEEHGKVDRVKALSSEEVKK